MASVQASSKDEIWPSLPLEQWKDTYVTLHLWLQMVGKIALELCAPVNHWWSVAFLVTPRGLRTRPIPYGTRVFEFEFDFTDHVLLLRTSDGIQKRIELRACSVAEFYRELRTTLHSLGIGLEINPRPQEMQDAVPFDQDTQHASYDREAVHRLSRILVQADRVLREFRAGFVGKCSPVQFFWGTFDLAVSRFSGRKAPPRPGVITHEAYSHEVSSVGFWPGSGNIREPAFYAYQAPEPEGFAKASILPREAFYNPPTRGFVLPYEAVRASADPDKMILDFAQSAYDAGATLAHWDRPELERPISVRKAA